MTLGAGLEQGGAIKSARLLADLAAAARRGAGPPAEHALAEHCVQELSHDVVQGARFTADLFRRIVRLVNRRVAFLLRGSAGAKQSARLAADRRRACLCPCPAQRGHQRQAGRNLRRAAAHRRPGATELLHGVDGAQLVVRVGAAV